MRPLFLFESTDRILPYEFIAFPYCLFVDPSSFHHGNPAYPSDFAESSPLGDTPEGFFFLDYDGFRKDLDTVILAKPLCPDHRWPF
jgi:hypothetical protein